MREYFSIVYLSPIAKRGQDPQFGKMETWKVSLNKDKICI